MFTCRREEGYQYLQVELVKLNLLLTASLEVNELGHWNYWWVGGGRKHVEREGKDKWPVLEDSLWQVW